MVFSTNPVQISYKNPWWIHEVQTIIQHLEVQMRGLCLWEARDSYWTHQDWGWRGKRIASWKCPESILVDWLTKLLLMERSRETTVTKLGHTSGKFWKDFVEIQQNPHVPSHFSSIKQRSITVLSSKLKKVNIICPIYRRLGKCMAHKSGRCPKSHDRNYVNICPLFLRGKCENLSCLRSHDASLAKMPVCRFYLEGLCNKDDCLYLHKKLSDKTKLCPEFLKGFCSLADKVNIYLIPGSFLAFSIIFSVICVTSCWRIPMSRRTKLGNLRSRKLDQQS